MTTPSTIRIPRGIVDAQSNLAYVVGKEGRIFCLSLDTGEVLASTDNALVPVVINAGILIGWSYTPHRPNEIQLSSVVRKGRVLRLQWEQTLPLPEWVDISSPEPDSFMLEAEFRQDHVIITWEAHVRYRGGAAPSVEVEKAAKHDERQTLELDGKNGEITGKQCVKPAPRLERVTPQLEPKTKIVPYRSGTTRDTHTWRVGAINACLIRTADEQGIVLLHQDGVGSKKEIRLTSNSKAVATVTLDGSLIFIHDPDETESTWQVFFTETGKQLADFGFDPGTEGVSVVKDCVLYVVSEDVKGENRRTLRCWNVSTGKPMWSFVLNEEAVRVAPPPPQ